MKNQKGATREPRETPGKGATSAVSWDIKQVSQCPRLREAQTFGPYPARGEAFRGAAAERV